jgi:hypothetical protein
MTMSTVKGILKVLPVLALLAGLSACGSKRPPEDPTGFINAMIRELEDPDFTVRRCAATALGQMGPRAAIAVLALNCALDDEECTVRDAVRTALNRIRPESRLEMARNDR